MSYPVCSTDANLDQRRVLLARSAPRPRRSCRTSSQYRAIGTQDYRGLKLSFQRRAASGVSLSGNYTLSHCIGRHAVTGNFIQFSNG